MVAYFRFVSLRLTFMFIDFSLIFITHGGFINPIWLNSNFATKSLWMICLWFMLCYFFNMIPSSSTFILSVLKKRVFLENFENLKNRREGLIKKSKLRLENFAFERKNTFYKGSYPKINPLKKGSNQGITPNIVTRRLTKNLRLTNLDWFVQSATVINENYF